MGIGGLKTFIDSKPLRTDSRLSATKLVIDGNNLQRNIYAVSCRLNCDIVYGGNYHSYRLAVIQFFDALKQCAIIPIVCLDGISYPTLKKIKKKRSAQILNSIDIILKGNGKYEEPNITQDLFPPLANYVYISTLIELEIETIQTLYYADNLIAFTANKHGCPVLSDDSDFCVFNLPNGVIAFESFHYQRLTAGDTQIECKIFKFENFLQLYPDLQQNHLPLFAVIMGNDYSDNQNMKALIDDIIKQTKFEKHQSIRSGSGRQAFMDALFGWLQKRTVDKALKVIRGKLRQNEQILNEVMLAIQKYDLFGQNYDQKEDNVYGLPEWLVSNYYDNILFRPMLLKILIKRRLSLTPRVCDLRLYESPAAWLSTLYTRLFALLVTKAEDKTASFTIKDHRGLEMFRKAVKPLRQLDIWSAGGEPLPYFDEIETLDIGKRKLIILKMLDFDNRWDELERQLMAKFELTAEQLDRVINLIVTLRYCRLNAFVFDDERQSLVRSVIACVLRYMFNLQCMQTDNSFGSPTSDKIEYQPRVVHLFAQYCSILGTQQIINCLLGFPLGGEKLVTYLDGVLVHDLTIALISETDRDGCVEKLIADKQIESLYKFIVDRVFRD